MRNLPLFIVAVLYCTMAAFSQTKATTAASKTGSPQKVKTPVVWTQEPDGFKGAKFGASRSDLDFLSQECWDPSSQIAAMGREKCERIEQIGDVGVSLRYYLRDDKLVEVEGSFESKGFDELRKVFIEVYGRPHQTAHTPARTALGVMVVDEDLFWAGKRVSILLSKYLGNINDGGFSISLKSEDALIQQMKRDAHKKAVDSIR